MGRFDSIQDAMNADARAEQVAPQSRTEAILRRISLTEERIRLITEGPFGQRTRELTGAENLALRAKRQRIKELSTELRNLRTAAVKARQKPRHT